MEQNFMQQNKWMDIHNHIMPMVDDGSKSWEMTQEMLNMAYEEGFRAIILTPHFGYRFKRIEESVLQESFNRVKEMAERIDPDFAIYLGNELYYFQEALSLLQKKEIKTLAGSDYVLVEFSPQENFEIIKNSLHTLQMEGYKPILAHVERYEQIRKKTDGALILVNMGVYLQVNAASIIGERGYKIKRYIHQLLKEECVHFVATDAHRITERSPVIQKCSRHLINKFGIENANRVLWENPSKILINEKIIK